MSNGILLFAHNNELVDYVDQAVFCAKRVQKYMGLPVSLVTNEQVDNKVFDKVIYKSIDNTKNFRSFKNGSEIVGRDNWYNTDRFNAYNLTPYDKTIVLDTDFIVCNNNLINLFESKKSFACSKKHCILQSSMQQPKSERIALNSIPMYWATVMYFTKSSLAKSIFDFVSHIHDNWLWYKNLYGINSAKFRNDYAFSIAIHTMQNFTESVTDFEIPYAQYNSFDTDDIIYNKDDQFHILSKRGHNDYHITYLTGTNIHIMNKFSLEKIIKGEQ